MLARIRKAQENESGFTLIELLVVMIIIGILAAIAIPAFLSQKTKARESAAKSDASNIAKTIAAAIVDGNLAATGAALTGTKSAPIVTLTYADTTLGTVVLSTTSTTDPIKLSSNNAIVTTTASGDAYCVEVQAYKSVTGDTATDAVGDPWKANQDGVFKGSC